MFDSEPTFLVDAVELMRSARDEISKKIEGMTVEEELVWLAAQEIEDPFLRRLLNRSARTVRGH